MKSKTCLEGKLAILVPSCDRYSDLWNPFLTLFWKFWPDCPLPVYLLSNFASVADDRVRTLPVGEDVSWSDNLAKALDRLNYEYILLFLDDLFLTSHVDTKTVLGILDWAVQSKVNYLRFNPSPKADRYHNDITGVVSPGTVYRTATVMSVWRKDVLLSLLRPGENAWDFEIKGSIRSDEFDGFFSTWEKHFPVINGVIKGKWLPSAARTLEKLGVEIDLTSRPVMSRTRAMVHFCKQQRSSLLKILPSKYRRSVRYFIMGLSH
jgi:hypothetical protein